MSERDRQNGDDLTDTSICAEDDCSRPAGVKLHVPWEDPRVVCPACARSAAQQDGVVARPIEGRDDVWETR